MKKLMAVLGLCGVFGLAACDKNADAATGNYAAQNGDTVVIDFAGYMDGVQFPGGTGSAYPLTLGSGTFVPGFEEQLIGAKVGDVRDINITFPQNYYPEMAGRAVVFRVTVNDIIRK